MIISFFKTNHIAVYFYLLLYAFLLRGAFLFHPAMVPIPGNSFAGRFLYHNIPLQSWSAVFPQLADILLIITEAIFFNFILTINGLFDRHTFVPAMVFITFSSIFPQWVAYDVATIASVFILLSLYNLFRLADKDLSRNNIFYTSLYIGIASLFYFPATLFIAIILIGLLTRSYILRDFLLIVIGFILPFYFIGIWFYYQGDLDNYINILLSVFRTKYTLFYISTPELIFLAFAIILSIAGFFVWFSSSEYKVIKQRRLMNLFIFYFIISALATPAINSDKFIYLKTLMLPASVFAARFFDAKNLRFYHHILFVLLLGGIVFFQLVYFKVIGF